MNSFPTYSIDSHPEASINGFQNACKLCSQNFTTWEDYESHMLNSQAHKFCCDICLIDFRYFAAYKRHREHMHPLHQNLKCQTCSKTFPRLAGLIGHYESSQCKSLTGRQLETVRKEKLRKYDTQKSASNFQKFSSPQSPLMYREESFSTPLPIRTQTSNGNYGTLIDTSDTEEDLISFNDRTTTWDSVPKTKNLSVRTFPDSSMIESRSSVEQGGVSLVANKNTDPILDPYSPGFRPETFFVPLLLKYKCPHRGCGKAFTNRTGFMSHMKSQTHLSRKLQCKGCLKYFGSTTALIQHSESQSLRCKIRELADYEQVVDIMTSGVATVAGRLRDNTVAYSTTNNGIDIDENLLLEADW